MYTDLESVVHINIIHSYIKNEVNEYNDYNVCRTYFDILMATQTTSVVTIS